MKEIDVDVLDMLDEQIKTQETLLKKRLSKASGAREYKISNFDVTDKKMVTGGIIQESILFLKIKRLFYWIFRIKY